MLAAISDFYRWFISGGLRYPEPRKAYRQKLLLEELETRVLLTTNMFFWSSNASGNWEDATNWSSGMVPGSGDVAVISPSTPVTVTMSSTDTVQGIQIGANQTLLLTARATLTVTATFASQGTLNADSSGLNISSATATNNGTLQALHGGTLEFVNTALNNAQGEIVCDASTIENLGSITAGTMQLTNGSTLENGLLSSSGGDFPGVISGATISLTGSSILTGGDGTLDTITIPAATDLHVKPGSDGDSNQTLIGTTTDDGAIELDPTTAYVNVYVNSSVTLSGAGRLTMELGGPRSGGGSFYALLQVASGATLTNGAGHSITGSGYINGQGSFVNQGSVLADVQFGQFVIESSGGVTNTGLIQMHERRHLPGPGRCNSGQPRSCGSQRRLDHNFGSRGADQ